jgi:hypothetical protein
MKPHLIYRPKDRNNPLSQCYTLECLQVLETVLDGKLVKCAICKATSDTYQELIIIYEETWDRWELADGRN